MELQALLTADYLDILFDHRNKNYGGYELRKHYPQRVKIALGIVLFVACAASAYGWYANRAEATHSVHLQNHTVELKNLVDVTPPPPPKPIVEIEAAAPDVKVARYDIPVIVDDKDVAPDELLSKTKDLKDAQIGNT